MSHLYFSDINTATDINTALMTSLFNDIKSSYLLEDEATTYLEGKFNL